VARTFHLYLDDSGTRHPDKGSGDPEHRKHDWFALGGVVVDEADEDRVRESLTAGGADQRRPAIAGTSSDYALGGRDARSDRAIGDTRGRRRAAVQRLSIPRLPYCTTAPSRRLERMAYETPEAFEGRALAELPDTRIMLA
jgi:hypothetical protein